ncbi:hypothetical protein HWV62_39686 [Athelia sp. TMB]|nr:hypothetical protein HWV62_39686 [Athelia sp. TMB]
MSTEIPDLSTLARSKLHLSVGGKDSCSLHRWVLLKNSIVRSTTPSPSTSTISLEKCHISHVNPTDEIDTEEEEVCCEENDAFLFPDAYKLNSGADSNVSEAAWLDSLLETLGDEDDDTGSDVHVSVHPVDDDDDSVSPLMSPMSSSDDLINQQLHYYPSPIAVPYPVPYPPYHPPLIRSFELDSLLSPLDASLPPYRDPLPYYDIDDVEDLAVPEAIEDTSDDESDVLSTPSLIRSSTNLALVDPASIPLPAERRLPQLHIYVGPEDSQFYPYELDPLPFRDDRLPTYNHVYQEC